MFPTAIRRISLVLFLALGLVGLVRSLQAAVSTYTVTRVTTATTSNREKEDVAISGDGSQIAFSSDDDLLGNGVTNNDNVIWLYNTTTLTLTQITPENIEDRESKEPALDDDASIIAFVSDDNLHGGTDIARNQDEIWLTDPAGASFTRVTTASESSRDSLLPTLSGDGTKLAFASSSDFNSQGIDFQTEEIWMYDVGTKALTRITTDTNNNRLSGEPDFNQDGTKLVFQSDARINGANVPIGQTEIWLYDTGSTTFTRITTASASGRVSENPSISDDGTKIVFQSDSDFQSDDIPANQVEIWLYDTTGPTLTRITTASGATRDSEEPVISGDGTRIVFESDSDFNSEGRGDNIREVWEYNLTNDTFTRLTDTTSGRNSEEPVIDRTGSKVAFRGDNDFLNQGGIDSGEREVWMLSANAAEIELEGNGQPISNGSTSTGTSNHTEFIDATVGGSSTTRTFTIKNPSVAGLSLIGDPAVALSNGTHFAVSQQPSTNVAASGQTTFEITFTPTSSGVLTDLVSIANSDPDDSPFTFTISGEGIVSSNPEIGLTGNGTLISSGSVVTSTLNSTDFGTVKSGTDTVVRTFTIENYGSSPLTLSGNPLVNLATGSEFTVTQLPSTGSISGGSSTTFQIEFAPAVDGAYQDTVTILSNDSDEGTYTFVISGVGGDVTTELFLPLLTR